MNFRTELHLAPASRKLSLASSVITVGSCFSEVIGKQLEKYKVKTLTNPFGTIFNPLSACKLLQACCGIDIELANAFVERDGRWYSYDFHSSFSAETEEALYELLDEVVVKTRRFLKQADLLIITLGTANVFRLNITGETVANCHKMPANNFEKETLNPEEIIAAVAETQSMLRELNPNLRMVLSVSPVRHIKDTLELNSVSKSVLRLATHYITQQLPEIFYFPAFELLLDDLRDYRFYKPDMLHPSEMAEQYIWQKFNQVYFDEAFREFTSEWDKMLRAMEHKPFQLATEAHQNFVQTMLQKLETLKASVNTDAETAFFKSQVRELPKPVEKSDEEIEEEEEANETGASAASEPEAFDDIPEIDDEIIESKYPAKKQKKGPKLPKHPIVHAEPDYKKPAASPISAEPKTEAPESEIPANETPEERKRRKKKERRKKKKTVPNTGSENQASGPVSDETTHTPVILQTTDLTSETPTEAIIPAVSVSGKKPKKGKKGKSQPNSPAAENTENPETAVLNPADHQTEIPTEAPDQNSRPIVFSKYYLERLAREKAEGETEDASSPTQMAASSADAEAPALAETETTLQVAALGSGQSATVSEAPVKKRGGRSKKQTPIEKSAEQTSIPETSAPLPALPVLQNVTELPAAPENQPISESRKGQPNNRNQKSKAPKKGRNQTQESASILPETAALPAATETENRPIPAAEREKPARPIKAAKVRTPKNPDAATETQTEVPAPAQAQESKEEIQPEPAQTVPISGKNSKSKPAKASKTVKQKAAELPLLPEPAAAVSPEIPEETETSTGISKAIKQKPSGAKTKQSAKQKQPAKPTELPKTEQTAKPDEKPDEPAKPLKPEQAAKQKKTGKPEEAPKLKATAIPEKPTKQPVKRNIPAKPKKEATAELEPVANKEVAALPKAKVAAKVKSEAGKKPKTKAESGEKAKAEVIDKPKAKKPTAPRKKKAD